MPNSIYNRMVELGVTPYSMEQPVYKYRSMEAAIEILITNQVYFPTAKELERYDRLELHRSILDLSFTQEEKAKHLIALDLGFNDCPDQHYREKIQPLSIEFAKTQIGLFSAGKSPNNGPLWERYGNLHKGICLGFIIPPNTIATDLSFNVNYTKNPTKIKLFDVVGDNPFSNDVFYWLCTKQERYSYEEEVRIINDKGFGFRTFEKGMLFEIILGMDTTERDYNLISKVAADYGYNVKINKIAVDDDDYELKVVEAITL